MTSDIFLLYSNKTDVIDTTFYMRLKTEDGICRVDVVCRIQPASHSYDSRDKL